MPNPLAKTPVQSCNAMSLRSVKWPLAVLGAALASAVAQANPSGAHVVRGNANVVTHGNQLSVTASDGAIINWRTFSIESGQTTRFIQPGANARVLNRVTGQDPSRINGQLLANGQVYLINRNGVVFGAGSVVDTAGLVASTLGLSNEDFANSIHSFSGNDAGGIINRGYIRTSGNGDIVLIAPTIENHGLIETQSGDLLLAAGEQVVIQSLDVEHVSFEVTADSGDVLNLGQLLTDDGAIGLFARHLHVAGEVHANRLARDSQGRIQLVAADSNLVTGLVTARGDDSEIVVDGKRTEVAQTAAISADTGGRLITYGDQHLIVEGQLQAENGFVETSSAGGLKIERAPRVGAGGLWLIDPTDINIVADNESGGSDDAPDVAQVGVDQITDLLDQGGEVLVRTLKTGTGNGDINVLAEINHEGAGRLRLVAHNDINVRQKIDTPNVDVVLDARNGDVDVLADVRGRSLNVTSSSVSVNDARIETSSSVVLKSGDVTFHRATIDASRSININANGNVIVSKDSQLSAVRDINVTAANVIATQGSQVTSESNINLVATQNIRLTTGDDADTLIVAGNTISLDSPRVVLNVPDEFAGQLITAATVDLPKGAITCNNCDPQALIGGTLTGLLPPPGVIFNDDSDNDPVDSGDVVTLIDTSSPTPKPPASDGSQRPTHDTELSNPVLVSPIVYTPDDESTTADLAVESSTASQGGADASATPSSVNSSTSADKTQDDEDKHTGNVVSAQDGDDDATTTSTSNKPMQCS